MKTTSSSNNNEMNVDEKKQKSEAARAKLAETDRKIAELKAKIAGLHKTSDVAGEAKGSPVA